MIKLRVLMYSVGACLLLLIQVACTAQPTAAPAATGPEEEAEPESEATGVLVLADIDEDDPVSKIEEFQPIADYLAEHLGDYGIGSGEVKIAPDLDTMISWLNTGEVDLFYDSPFPAAIVSKEAGAIPVARGWRGGEPVYHSLFFTRSDSGIDTLEELAGHVVAYDDAASTSGYLMPTAFLVENGMNPVEVSSAASSVGDDKVGYVFSGDDENTIEWVLSGQVDIGVVDNLTYANDIPEVTRAELTIIAETEDVPRRFMMASSHLDAALVEAIQQLLVDMVDDPEAADLLDTLKTARFDLFEDPQATLDQMQELLALVEGQ